MIYKYSLYAKAQKDYEESLNWYLERSEQAAIGFIDAVNVALNKISNYPHRYRNTYKHYYEIRLKKYPFIIIYSIEKESRLLIIWKIFHYKKNPKKKFSGLKEV